MNRILGCVMILLTGLTSNAQTGLQTGDWQAKLLREDGNHIVFNFEVQVLNQKPILVIKNGAERIRVNNVRMKADSVWIQMPVFESYFKLVKKGNRQLTGTWYKAGSKGVLEMPFEANAKNSTRFVQTKTASFNISGKWAVRFFRADGSARPAIGEFVQKGNQLTGTFITPTGDYRYLAGIVDGDAIKLSTFDGSHAYFFNARIENPNKIVTGQYFSGGTSIEPWDAVKDANVTLPDLAAMYLKDGEERLNFRFRDLNGKWVSINDQRFKNKVVIIQIMGSWCPNCMDETAFLSDYYKRNKQRGVEVVGLAYEYYEDFSLARSSLKKFRDRYDVQYPMLITGVTVSDSLRTEKTLPQLTPIKSFPSTIFINKKGEVAKIHAGFAGPGTGAYYQALKKEFEETVDTLLKK